MDFSKDGALSGWLFAAGKSLRPAHTKKIAIKNLALIAI